jgi:hypothetical protein
MTKKVTLVFVALLFFGISGAAHAQTNSRMYAPAPTASAPCLLNAAIRHAQVRCQSRVVSTRIATH